MGSTSQDYHKEFDLMMAALKELKESVKNPERAERVAFIEKQSIQYDAAFVSVVALTQQRQASVEQLNATGLNLRQMVSKMIDRAAQDKDIEETVLAGKLQEQLLLGRLYMVKYLESHHTEDFKRAQEEMQVKVEEFSKTLRQKTQSSEMKGLLDQFEKDHQAYVTLMATIFDLIKKSDDLIQNTLDRIGPEVANTTEELKTVYNTSSSRSLEKLNLINVL